jgi:hypothetical protein
MLLLGPSFFVLDTFDMMTSYLMSFVLFFWPFVADHPRQLRDAILDCEEVAATDATPEEALELMGFAALESNFIRDAKGKAGERGAWQVMPPARSYGADEALSRLRRQGTLGYVGCRRSDDMVVIGGVRLTCGAVVAHRVDRAHLYRMAFDPPASALRHAEEEEQADAD